ncbi:MAG TPA: hypothetical protein VFK05_06140 [Polyangiaceae bacterium]|nr:hypothetical protein [Polyangiaceae bacterium]
MRLGARTAENWSRAVFERLEAFLDARLEVDPDLFVERVELQVRVEVHGDDDAVDEIAQRIGMAILEAKDCALKGLENANHATGESLATRTSAVERFAGGRSSSKSSRRATHAGGRTQRYPTLRGASLAAADTSREAADFAEAYAQAVGDTLAETPLRLLARIARTARWSELRSLSARHAAERFLRALREELVALRAARSEMADISDASDASARSRIESSKQPGLALPADIARFGHLCLLAALARSSRLHDRPRNAAPWLREVDRQLVALAAVPEESSRERLLPRSSSESANSAVEKLAKRNEGQESTGLAESCAARWPLDSTSGHHASGVVEEERESAISAAEDFEDNGPLTSPYAGLAFFIPVLLDLGLAAALDVVHPQPSLIVYRVLRELLGRLAIFPSEDDAAVWLLAGLRDAPSEQDRADDAAEWDAATCVALARAAGCDGEQLGLADAARAWADAAIAEAVARFAGAAEAIDLANDVVRNFGVLVADDEELTVTLPFPRVYAALLLAAMLSDVGQVPWLEHRALRLVFEGGIS